MNDHVIHVLTTNKMFKIACTRFTDITIMENYRYRETRKIPCIYCSPVPISETHRRDTYLFVFEMNNTTNQIMGIGLIQNTNKKDRTYIVYDMTRIQYNYNRYIYKGDYWLSRDQLPAEMVEIFDQILFKGKSHLKSHCYWANLLEHKGLAPIELQVHHHEPDSPTIRRFAPQQLW